MNLSEISLLYSHMGSLDIFQKFAFGCSGRQILVIFCLISNVVFLLMSLIGLIPSVEIIYFKVEIAFFQVSAMAFQNNPVTWLHMF